MTTSIDTTEHPTLILRRLLDQFGPYPPHTLPVQEVIAGTAFFPGGRGLWMEETAAVLPRWPDRGVMVIGQDFDSESSYRKSLARGKEKLESGTWRNLLPLLSTAGVRPDECFFTNLFMGVRRGDKSTGRHPDVGERGFVLRCEQLLLREIEMQRPRIILALGIIVPRFLSELSPELVRWRDCCSFAKLDLAAPVVRSARFTMGQSQHTAHVGVLTHPSYRHVNVGCIHDGVAFSGLRRPL